MPLTNANTNAFGIFRALFFEKYHEFTNQDGANLYHSDLEDSHYYDHLRPYGTVQVAKARNAAVNLARVSNKIHNLIIHGLESEDKLQCGQQDMESVEVFSILDNLFRGLSNKDEAFKLLTAINEAISAECTARISANLGEFIRLKAEFDTHFGQFNAPYQDHMEEEFKKVLNDQEYRTLINFDKVIDESNTSQKKPITDYALSLEDGRVVANIIFPLTLPCITFVTQFEKDLAEAGFTDAKFGRVDRGGVSFLQLVYQFN